LNSLDIKIDFIIPAFNSEKTIHACLESIKANLPNQSSRIIVVNNNSTDRTKDIVLAMNIELIDCYKQGRSEARNAGWRASSADYIAFIDSDIILEKNWLNNLVDLFDIASICGIQGAIIPAPQSSFINKFLYDLKKKKTNGYFIDMETDEEIYPLLDTAACIYRRQSLVILNGFDESLDFHEDYDLSIRAVANGFSIGASDKSLAYKDANRSPVNYLIRTIQDSKAFSNYVIRYSRPNYILHLIDAFNFRSSSGLFGIFYNLIKCLSYIVFYTYYLITMKSKPLQELKVSEAKLNLTSPELIDFNNHKYRLSLATRFYIGSSGIRFFNGRFRSVMNKDLTFKLFFFNYLKGIYTKEDFEKYKNLMLDRKIIIRLSTQEN